MKQYDEQLLFNIQLKKLEKTRIEAKSERSQLPRLDEVSHALDEYYFLNQLQLYCTYLCYYNVVHANLIKYDSSAFRLIPHIVSLIETGEVRTPFLVLFNHIRQVFENIEKDLMDSEKHFDKALQLIYANSSENTHDICLEAFSILNNFCILMINQGKERYVEKSFEICNEILNRKYGVESKRKLSIPVGMYKNMVVSAIRIKNKEFWPTIYTKGLESEKPESGYKNAFEWTSKFVASFKNRLVQRDREKYHRFCKAYIEYQQGEFIAAYKTLGNPSRLRGMFINMSIRMLHLQVLFEVQLSDPAILDKDDIDVLDIVRFSEAMRKLVEDDRKNKKQLSYHRKYFAAFERLYHTMIRIYVKYRQPYMTKDKGYIREMDKFKQEIEASSYSFSSWFEQKYHQI